MNKNKLLRITFQQWQKGQIEGQTNDGKTVRVVCDERQTAEMEAIAGWLCPGNIFHLLNVERVEEGSVRAELLIFEPDYLFDISSLAECFKPYGHHPLNYSLRRVEGREKSRHMIIGNVANAFIDEQVYEEAGSEGNWVESLQRVFRASAFEITACRDLQDPATEAAFFSDCKKHFEHIRQVVHRIFPQAGIDREKIVLEPSFICYALGLHGRMDMMLDDSSKLIELKSGRAMENYETGGSFVRSAENHYVQMILYLAVLEFNLGVASEAVDSYLLYSKYPVLSKEQHSRKQLKEALALRNRIVACDFALQQANASARTGEVLGEICSEKLNTKHLTNNLFTRYLAPGIDRFRSELAQLSELEKVYFFRLYTFITKELWVAKVGEREYEGVKKASVLWNAPLEDKLQIGELLYDLKIIENRTASAEQRIRLEIPKYDDLYLPNFRMGDAVVLYERVSSSDSVNDRQVFKGAIEKIEESSVTIRLRYRQKNSRVWNSASRYAIEHDHMDTTHTGMFHALSTFLCANPDRRELLLSQRPGGEEVFLLVGPPGSGKTSMALKQMVADEWKKGSSNVLLLSYTNRAVDEICQALTDIKEDFPFIRIGNEVSCAEEFRPFLLENQLKGCRRRKEVKEVIESRRVFVGTVASICTKMELFQWKNFDLAIVDEATQLLEPHLIGIFCAKNVSGANAVKRFVLIGDHKQLPAVVLQTKTESRVDEPLLRAIGMRDLSDSLFERLYRKYQSEGRHECFATLKKQGRMHPEIAAFPSEHFYDGLLGCAGLPHQMEERIEGRRLYFYHVSPSGQDLSVKTNRREAEQVVEICRMLHRSCTERGEEFRPESIGIITPFRSQIAMIRRLLHESGIAAFAGIVVDTVERFQGSQREVIIYSFCIQTESQLTALPSWLEEGEKRVDRKLNVAITRAKELLYVVGNEELLTKNPLYGQLIKHMKKGEEDWRKKES
jgi:hypothetical protein